MNAVPYLSRIWLNPLRTRTQRFLRDPQALHAAVLGAVSRQPVSERVLWRLDVTTPHRADLLVLTGSSPSWEHLVEQAGWPGADEPQALVRSYDPVLNRLATGREYAFRLRANPVSATRRPTAPSTSQEKALSASRPRGVRVPHRTAAHQIGWLTDRIERWGFAVPPTRAGAPQVQISGRDRLTFTKRDDGNPHRVVLQTATFEGIVRVLDPHAARASLLDGVGRARAYGCGLITLAPTTQAS